MSFGTSIGDIIAVSKLASGVWSRLRDSSDQFKVLCGEVSGLKLVLDDAAERVSSQSLSADQITKLFSLVEECQNVLRNLDAMIEKYQSLNQGASGPVNKAGRLYKKLAWDHKEVDSMRLRLITNLSLLEAFNSDVASKVSNAMSDKVDALRDTVEELRLGTEQKDCQNLLDWLSSLNFNLRQDELSHERQEGTGGWLLQSEAFQTWEQSKGQSLLCQGIPGAGKTMLASLVIDHLRGKALHQNSAVLFIYCDYRAEAQQTSVQLLLSLLKQSLQQQQKIDPQVRESLKGHKQKGTRPDNLETSKLIKISLAIFSRVFIIIDALDELSSRDEWRPSLFENFRDIQAATDCNILVTSREMPYLLSEIPRPLLIEIRASFEDVQRYLHGHVRQFSKCALKNLDLQNLIISSIANAVDGMFLLAQLHLQSLEDQTTPKMVKESLKSLPKGKKALQSAYNDAMQRIDSQPEGFRTLAKQVLGWLTYAKRLISITELRYAIAIQISEERFDQDNLADADELVSVCASLVFIDQSQNVRLVHYTTQEFLDQNCEVLLPRFPRVIAETCLTYLQYEKLGNGWRSLAPYVRNPIDWHRTTAQELLVSYLPFYAYAASFWALHVEACSLRTVQDLLLGFVSNDYKVSCALEFLLNAHLTHRMKGVACTGRPYSVMHLLAYIGNHRLMQFLLEHSFDAGIRGYDGRTPLWFAAYKGNQETTDILLAHGREDVNKKSHISSFDGGIALTVAAHKGHLGVVQRLLTCEAVDPNFSDINRFIFTPLYLAAHFGATSIIEVLLARKEVEPDKRASDGSTALIMAARSGHNKVVQRLLQCKDVNPNAKDTEGRSALWMVADGGWRGCDEEIVRSLLTCSSIDVNATDNEGRTPLMQAAIRDTPKVLQLLLTKRGIDVNARDNKGDTALYAAAVFTRDEIVKILVERSDINLDVEIQQPGDLIRRLEKLAKDEHYQRRTKSMEDVQRRQQASRELLGTLLKERAQRQSKNPVFENPAI